MQFVRSNILSPNGYLPSGNGSITITGNNTGEYGNYYHPTGMLWGNPYTGKEILDGDIISKGKISAALMEAANGNFTNIASEVITNSDRIDTNIMNAVTANANQGNFENAKVTDTLSSKTALIDNATIKDLFVSGSAHFIELVIDKINSTNGSFLLSPAHAQLSRVEAEGDNIKCYFLSTDGNKKITNDFEVDDLVICESFNVVEGYSEDVTNKFIWKRILEVGTTEDGEEHWFKVKNNDIFDTYYMSHNTNSEFEAEDVVCVLGNWSKSDRQKAILLSTTNPNLVEVGHLESSVEGIENNVYFNIDESSEKVHLVDNVAIDYTTNSDFWTLNSIKSIKLNIKEFNYNEPYLLASINIKKSNGFDYYDYGYFDIWLVGDGLYMRNGYYSGSGNDTILSSYRKLDSSILNKETKISFNTERETDKFGYTYRIKTSLSDKYYSDIDDWYSGDDTWRIPSNLEYIIMNIQRELSNHHSVYTHNNQYLRTINFDLNGYRDVDSWREPNLEHNYITNGFFEENSDGWVGDFSRPPIGLAPFINIEENAFLYYPYFIESWNGESKPCNFDATTSYNSNNLHSQRGVYKLVFDYASEIQYGTQEPLNTFEIEFKYRFTYTVGHITYEKSYKQQVNVSLNGVHKYEMYLVVLYDYEEELINISEDIPHFKIIIDTEDNHSTTFDGLDIHIHNTGNQNWFALGNVMMYYLGTADCNIEHHAKVYKHNTITNPIESPAIITFDNINDFSLADKHISVLSPTYNLISANSVSGLDDKIAEGISHGTLTPEQINQIIHNLFDSIDFIDSTNFEQTLLSCTDYIQTKESILLKADNVTVTNLSDKVDGFDARITANSAAIQVNADAIKLKVDKSDFDELGNRVGANESSITQLSDQIKLKVDKTDFDALGNRVSANESSITTLSDQIKLKVNQTDFDALGNRVGSVESSITTLSDQISLKVNQTDFDALGGRVGEVESQISLKADAIDLTTLMNDIETVGIHLDGLNSKISLNANNFEINSVGDNIRKTIGVDESGRLVAFGINRTYEEPAVQDNRRIIIDPTNQSIVIKAADSYIEGSDENGNVFILENTEYSGGASMSLFSQWGKISLGNGIINCGDVALVTGDGENSVICKDVILYDTDSYSTESYGGRLYIKSGHLYFNNGTEHRIV